jgi:hypothetical protein
VLVMRGSGVEKVELWVDTVATGVSNRLTFGRARGRRAGVVSRQGVGSSTPTTDLLYMPAGSCHSRPTARVSAASWCRSDRDAHA